MRHPRRMKLTPHFSLDELTASQTAARHGIDNRPDEGHLTNLKRLCEQLEQVRSLLDNQVIIVSSGYRSPALNSKVSGSKTSAHCIGLAADFISPSYGSPLQICEAIADSDIAFDQMIHEYGRWVHLAVTDRMEPARRITLTKCSQQPYIQGLHSCS